MSTNLSPNVQAFIKQRTLLQKACDCPNNKMKCGGDPMYCENPKANQISAISSLIWKIFTPEERIELHDYDDAIHGNEKHSEVVRKAEQDPEYQAYLAESRLETIAQLTPKIIVELQITI